ncbi:hypothetical protein HPG69_011630 [Diceros bicornis minor]|uniref:Uncharacterized protein n=1 Tax=Diceros bicornis minor TaxID=77932 RepID=A0A7J7EHM3_DICBM|nr:hypothetical protein HPG69_011630 [Diceros bicornis minor]
MKYVYSSLFSQIFRPDNCVFSESGAGKGHRKEEAEMYSCCRLQGCLLTHWLGERHGIWHRHSSHCKICEQDPDHLMITFSMVPSPKVSDSVDKYHLLCPLRVNRCSTEEQEQQLLQRIDPRQQDNSLQHSTPRAQGGHQQNPLGQGKEWVRCNSWMMRATSTPLSQKIGSIRMLQERGGTIAKRPRRKLEGGLPSPTFVFSVHSAFNMAPFPPPQVYYQVPQFGWPDLNPDYGQEKKRTGTIDSEQVEPQGQS